MGQIKQRHQRFQVDVRTTKGRLRPSFDSYDAANTWLKEVEKKDKLGIDITNEVANVTAVSMNVRELAEETLNRHWRGCKSEMSLWRNAKDVYLRVGASRPVRDVNERVIDDLVYELERDGKANATINRRLAALSKMLKHAYRRGYIARMPLIERKREPKGRVRWITAEEETAMVGKFKEMGRTEMADFVKILTCTGLRTGELFKLLGRDVNLEERVVHLWDTKNGKSRSVPLTHDACDALSRNLKQGNERLFTFTQDAFSHCWKTMKHLIGLGNDDEFVPHCLRHTCASRLVQRGMSLPVLMEWLGHSSISTTLRYAHLAPKSLEKARDALESRDQTVTKT